MPGRVGSRHALAVAWFVVIALLVLAPALAHGAAFGSYDLLRQFGVLHQHGLVVHNLQAGDQSDSTIPVADLSWIQIHHGHLPLWNPYGALGLPLAFNWQAASFSVPALIGYLFPFNLAFTVQVVITLIIAGTGAYAFGRVLNWAMIPCLFAGTVFELSGPMIGWLGWPTSSVLAWSGWLFAAAFLILNRRAGVLPVAGLALVVAAMFYAGHPEVLALVALSLVIAVAVVLARRSPHLGGSGPVRRPLIGLVTGTGAGIALAAPLLLPGLQVIAGSQHAAAGGDPAELVKGNPPLPGGTLLHLAFQGYDGLPIAGNHWFGYAGGYSETAAYVGIIPLVLVVVGVVACRRRPEVSALIAVVVAMTAIAFVPFVVAGAEPLPPGRGGGLAARHRASRLRPGLALGHRDGCAGETLRPVCRSTLVGRRVSRLVGPGRWPLDLRSGAALPFRCLDPAGKPGVGHGDDHDRITGGRRPGLERPNRQAVRIRRGKRARR